MLYLQESLPLEYFLERNFQEADLFAALRLQRYEFISFVIVQSENAQED